jgi:hypothetical protein
MGERLNKIIVRIPSANIELGTKSVEGMIILKATLKVYDKMV